MKLIQCSSENSILEEDLELSVRQKTIDKIKVMETPEGFYVVVHLKWAKGKEWYLTIRMDRNTPKLFKDLTRLNDRLRDICPEDGFEFFRNQELPPRPATANPPPSAKAQYKMPRRQRKKRGARK